MCPPLRTLPQARPLSWSVEVECLRVLVRLSRQKPEYAAQARMLAGNIAEGALEYALMTPEERVARRTEYSTSAVELVEEMEKKR